MARLCEMEPKHCLQLRLNDGNLVAAQPCSVTARHITSPHLVALFLQLRLPRGFLSELF